MTTYWKNWKIRKILAKKLKDKKDVKNKTDVKTVQNNFEELEDLKRGYNA